MPASLKEELRANAQENPDGYQCFIEALQQGLVNGNSFAACAYGHIDGDGMIALRKSRGRRGRFGTYIDDSYAVDHPYWTLTPLEEVIDNSFCGQEDRQYEREQLLALAIQVRDEVAAEQKGQAHAE